MQNFLNNLLNIPVAYAQSTSGEKEASGVANILGFIVQNLPLWITAVVVFVASLAIGAIVKRMVESRLASKITDEHQEVLIISGRIAFLVTVTIGATISLAIAGINITALLAAAGFGISFGLQDTIANFVAGLAILASRPFGIGDWIKVNGQTGKVVEIRTRATYLQTFDGLRLIVPNSQLYKGEVLSYTSNPMRRLKVPVYTRYGASSKEVVAICMHVVKNNPKILLQPKPYVVVSDLADSYMSFEVRFWVDSKSLWRRIQSSVFMGIQKRLEETGMDAPYSVTSLSFEQDLESTVLKTRQMEKEDIQMLLNERLAQEQAQTEQKKKLMQDATPSVTPAVLDQSGSSFLQAPALQPVPVPVQVDPTIPPAA